MNHWFTKIDAPITKRWVKRFAAEQWLVDFPRGAMGAVVSGADETSLTAHATFLRKNDLVGFIFESEDRHAHPAHRRTLSKNYSRCTLRFRWQSVALMALDAVNGATLTIEGRDAAGQARSWYVRLWNYAQGSGSDAVITLDFDALHGGFILPGEAQRVDPRDIDRMFISLVPPAYDPADSSVLAAGLEGHLTLSNIQCEGSGSVLEAGDAVVPPHELRICTAYDDMYHLVPERVLDSIERLGFRKVITHYIGMSHYFALGADGLLRADTPFNAAALAWHEAFADAAKRRGFIVIWSLSYELLDMFCPAVWKQRQRDGSPALTGYDPPSTLVSPASQPGTAFLQSVAVKLAQISAARGVPIQVQIGEPWWWVTNDHEPCLYDAQARLALGGDPVAIPDARGSLSVAQTNLLEAAGLLLAQSTSAIAAAVREAQPGAELLLLVYLPGVLSADAPELRRANLPLGWAYPAFEILQLEDYEWVTSRQTALGAAAVEAAASRLNYPVSRQHYLAGFVANADRRADWDPILRAAQVATERGAAEVFLWALPQVLRDGLTIFGEESDVQAFDDTIFPIEIGAEASVSPGFSTTVVTSASGFEFRNANWSQARLRFDAGPGVRGDDEIHQLLAFFRARRGSAIGFRFRDPYDFSSAGMAGAPRSTDQRIGTGDGATGRFALVKHYGDAEARRITRPRPGTVRVSIDGSELITGWSLDGGHVVLDVPPPLGAAISAGFLFDVPVRFELDRLDINRASFLTGEAPSVPLIEVREDEA